jgi:hypothetical protein
MSVRALKPCRSAVLSPSFPQWAVNVRSERRWISFPFGGLGLIRAERDAPHNLTCTKANQPEFSAAAWRAVYDCAFGMPPIYIVRTARNRALPSATRS